jgi:hypothetical protein
MSTSDIRFKERAMTVALWATLGIMPGFVLATAGYHYWTRYDPVRAAAWEQVKPQIDQTKRESDHEADTATEPIKEFFAGRKQNARAFAAEVLSIGGKWAYVKGCFQEGSHAKYIEKSFERNMFATNELKQVIESTVASYVSEIQGRENQLLVAIRADLDGNALASPAYLPALGNDPDFRREYEAMLQKVVPILTKDLGVNVTSEVVSWIAGDIATALLLEVGASLATELGISSSVLGAGAYAGVFTAGVTFIAALLVDMALDWVIRQAGYDPEGEVAAKVTQSLDRLERVILEGDPKTLERYEQAKFFASWSFTSSGRDSASAEVQSIESSGRLGLNRQLRHINDLRARLREQALQSLILEGSAQ